MEISRDIFSFKIPAFLLKTQQISSRLDYMFSITAFFVLLTLLSPETIFNDAILIKIYTTVARCVFKRIIEVETVQIVELWQQVKNYMLKRRMIKFYDL